jgi:hypothetical protein
MDRMVTFYFAAGYNRQLTKEQFAHRDCESCRLRAKRQDTHTSVTS